MSFVSNMIRLLKVDQQSYFLKLFIMNFLSHIVLFVMLSILLKKELVQIIQNLINKDFNYFCLRTHVTVNL